MMSSATNQTQWLALIHQLPARPPYHRVKIWRKLQTLGAVPLKNAVHLLPCGKEHAVAFHALLDEVRASGGEAFLAELRLLAGQSDTDVRALFDAARDAEYEEIARTARRLIDTGPASGADILRLQKRLQEVAQIDFFGAHGRQEAEAALAELDRRRNDHPDIGRSEPAQGIDPSSLLGRTWVTRGGVHVDRIASAWLIARFIDPQATFKFVDGRTYESQAGELRFDMADAEFTHEGDRCSFETLVLRAGLESDPGIVAIAEMIHDLDIGDGKFDHPETSGLGAMMSGVCASTDDDRQRIAMASEALNQFHAYFSHRKTE
jgi:hypothetical protein